MQNGLSRLGRALLVCAALVVTCNRALSQEDAAAPPPETAAPSADTPDTPPAADREAESEVQAGSQTDSTLPSEDQPAAGAGAPGPDPAATFPQTTPSAEPEATPSATSPAEPPTPTPDENALPATPSQAPAAETGADAEDDPTRSSLSTETRAVEEPVFVPGKGFRLETIDGDFSLTTRLRAQFLYQYIAHQDAEDRQAFMIRRARVTFTGNMWGEDLKYKVELAVSPRDVSNQPANIVMEDGTDSGLRTEGDVVQTSPLLDYYLDFTHLRDLSLRVGQFKVPFSRQRVVSSGNLQFVDRAVTNSRFTLDRDLGIDLFSKDLGGLDLLRYHAGIYIGEGRNGSNRTAGAGDAGLLYIARLELLPFGDFDDYKESDHERTPNPRLSLGAGYAFLQSDATSPYAEEALDRTLGGPSSVPVVDFNSHNATLDAVFKMSGFSAQTAFHLRSVEEVDGGNEGIGWMISGGYLFGPVPFEVAAEYAMVRGDEGSALADEDRLGMAWSYYLARHSYKLQADYFHIWDDAGFSEGDDRVRVQLQAAL